MKALICENPLCKKTFTAPLKTLNLQQNPSETYDACPYCLTKIEIIDEPLRTDEKIEEIQIEETQAKINQVKTKEKNNKNDKPTSCHYHPGYLSERSSKEQIPDECLVCKDIVECMLRKMRE
jgi:hypothetical protein